MYASNEIVSTEQRYFGQLNTMDTMYKKPLEEHGIETAKIFGNLDSLIRLHKTVLEEMEKIHKDWHPKTSDYSVAKVLKDYSIPFKLYVEYINSYDNALKNLQILEEDEKTRNFIEKLGGFLFLFIYLFFYFLLFFFNYRNGFTGVLGFRGLLCNYFLIFIIIFF